MHVRLVGLRQPRDLALEPKLLICARLDALLRGKDSSTILLQCPPYLYNEFVLLGMVPRGVSSDYRSPVEV